MKPGNNVTAGKSIPVRISGEIMALVEKDAITRSYDQGRLYSKAETVEALLLEELAERGYEPKK